MSYVHTPWNRRRFLGALGLGAGAGLLAPLLVQAAGDPTAIRRYVFVVMGNGIEEHNLRTPAAKAAIDGGMTSVTAVDGDLATAPALGALAGDTDLRPHAAAILRLSSKITGGSHTTKYKALNCARAPSQTVDSWVARTIHTTQPFDAVRLGVGVSSTASLQYGICYDTPRRSAPILLNPLLGHAQLFGSIATGASGEDFRRRGKLLDFARGDVKRSLDAFHGSSQERAKLEAYLAGIEEVQQLQERLVASDEKLRDAASWQGIDPDDGSLLQSAHPLTRLEAQFKLATAALHGDLTRTVVLTSSVGNEFSHTRYTSLQSIFEEDSSFSDVPWRHGVCHEAGSNPTYQKVMDRVIERLVEMIATMARALASVPEGDGTMLDHTAILLMSDNGDTHHSQAGNWPMLLVGGSAMGLVTGGKSLVSPSLGKSGHHRVSSLFSTLGATAGIEGKALEFGDEPEGPQEPIGALLS